MKTKILIILFLLISTFSFGGEFNIGNSSSTIISSLKSDEKYEWRKSSIGIKVLIVYNPSYVFTYSMDPNMICDMTVIGVKGLDAEINLLNKLLEWKSVGSYSWIKGEYRCRREIQELIYVQYIITKIY